MSATRILARIRAVGITVISLPHGLFGVATSESAKVRALFAGRTEYLKWFDRGYHASACLLSASAHSYRLHVGAEPEGSPLARSVAAAFGVPVVVDDYLVTGSAARTYLTYSAKVDRPSGWSFARIRGEVWTSSRSDFWDDTGLGVTTYARLWGQVSTSPSGGVGSSFGSFGGHNVGETRGTTASLADVRVNPANDSVDGSWGGVRVFSLPAAPHRNVRLVVGPTVLSGGELCDEFGVVYCSFAALADHLAATLPGADRNQAARLEPEIARLRAGSGFIGSLFQGSVNPYVCHPALAERSSELYASGDEDGLFAGQMNSNRRRWVGFISGTLPDYADIPDVPFIWTVVGSGLVDARSVGAAPRLVSTTETVRLIALAVHNGRTIVEGLHAASLENDAERVRVELANVTAEPEVMDTRTVWSAAVMSLLTSGVKDNHPSHPFTNPSFPTELT